MLDPDAYDRPISCLPRASGSTTSPRRSTTAPRWRSAQQRALARQPDRGRRGRARAHCHRPLHNQLIQADAQADYLWRQFALTTLASSSSSVGASLPIADGRGEDGEEEIRNGNNSTPTAPTSAFFCRSRCIFSTTTLRGVGGVRYDHIDQFGDQFTWSGSGSYLIRPTDTRLRLSYARAFARRRSKSSSSPRSATRICARKPAGRSTPGSAKECFTIGCASKPTYFYRTVHNLIEEIADELPGPIAGVPARRRRLQYQRVVPRRRADQSTSDPGRGWISPRTTPISTSGQRYRPAAQPTAPSRHVLRVPRRRKDVIDRAAMRHRRRPGLSRSAHATVPIPSPHRNHSSLEQLGGYGRTDLALSYRFGGRAGRSPPPPPSAISSTATIRSRSVPGSAGLVSHWACAIALDRFQGDEVVARAATRRP